jgi:peroxiredoxin
MRAACLCLVILLTAASPLLAQNPDNKTRPQTGPGGAPPSGTRNPRSQMRISGRIYVGELAPNFSLTNARGRDLKLSHFRGDWVLLSFGNTGEALAQLRSIHQDMRDMGVTVLGVARDKPQRLRTVADRDSVPFEMLADVTGEISAIYGLLDHERSTIRPGFLVLDRHGVIRLAVLGQALPPDQISQLTRFTVTGL